MKKPQWITLAAGVILTIAIFFFGRTIPHKKIIAAEMNHEHDGHEDDAATTTFSIDSILTESKKQLNSERVSRLTRLEKVITGNNTAPADAAGKASRLEAYHQLSHFWGDTVRFFPPYAWYEAESARLENSEKSLTFAAHLFLNSLQEDNRASIEVIKWKALQAKDLFERSLKINPDNDSARIGLGACYLFGNIAAMPMQGINMIRQVVQKDSTNIYGQMMLVKGTLMSGQIDKAIERLNTICRVKPDLDAILLLSELYERIGKTEAAVIWYRKSLEYTKEPEIKSMIEKRIAELAK